MQQIELTPNLFLSKLKDKQNLLFVFDYDGTIVALGKHNEAVLEPKHYEIINAVAALDHVTVAIVTGRSLANLKSLIADRLSDHILLYGTHGGEMLTEASNDNEYRPYIKQIIETFAQDHNLQLEIKPLSITIHYGDYPDLDNLAVRFEREAKKYQDIFRIQKGYNVYEFLPKAINKGLAVLDLYERYSKYYPVFFGDDLTDNYAFIEVNKLGGLSVQVSPRIKSLDSGYLINRVDDTYALLEEYLRAVK